MTPVDPRQLSLQLAVPKLTWRDHFEDPSRRSLLCGSVRLGYLNFRKWGWRVYFSGDRKAAVVDGPDTAADRLLGRVRSIVSAPVFEWRLQDGTHVLAVNGIVVGTASRSGGSVYGVQGGDTVAKGCGDIGLVKKAVEVEARRRLAE